MKNTVNYYYNGQDGEESDLLQLCDDCAEDYEWAGSDAFIESCEGCDKPNVDLDYLDRLLRQLNYEALQELLEENLGMAVYDGEGYGDLLRAVKENVLDGDLPIFIIEDVAGL